MKRFSGSTFILFVTGSLNFIPETGLLISSFGVILFSVIVIFSFLKMQHHILNDYQKFVERQQRLDYMGTLTSTLIHELKNSLTMLQGYSKLLKKTQTFDSKGTEWMDFLELGHHQLQNLVNSYSSFLTSKEIEMKICEVHKVIHTALQLTKHEIEENGYTVEFNQREKIWGFMNDTYMHQVFVNLIKNSIEATQPNCKLKKLKIRVRNQQEMILVDFIDSGNGIPRHKWNEIFTPFISSKSRGMGIGLSFCKKVLFEHRGDIEIISSSKNGTHFRITLPQYTHRV
ncbi:HAMP domain-containing sensor histidine kinase [Bacillus tianshenii]|nr:HAMP domain-containing sensor histidine kinase [Bacillus tianshenii]